MAHLNWHGNIVRTWKNKHNNLVYHLTEKGWLLRTKGIRYGGAKVVARPSQKELKAKIMHWLSNEEDWTSNLV